MEPTIPNSFPGGSKDDASLKNSHEDGSNRQSHEFTTKVGQKAKLVEIRERYEYQGIAPYRRSSKPPNRSVLRNTSNNPMSMRPVVSSTKSNMQKFQGKYQRAAPSEKELSANANPTNYIDPSSKLPAKMTSASANVEEISKVQNFQGDYPRSTSFETELSTHRKRSTDPVDPSNESLTSTFGKAGENFKVENYRGKYQRTTPVEMKLMPSNQKQICYDDRRFDPQSVRPTMKKTTPTKVVENTKVQRRREGSIPLNQPLRNSGSANPRRPESMKKLPTITAPIDQRKSNEVKHITNSKQMRMNDNRVDVQKEKEVNTNKVQSVRTIHKKREFKHTTMMRPTRNLSPYNSTIEAPVKITPKSAKVAENVQEKDKTQTPQAVQLKAQVKLNTTRKQSPNDSIHIQSKFEQYEKQTSMTLKEGQENVELKDAFEKCKIISEHLENELEDNKNRLKQATQSKNDLQQQIIALEKEKQVCVTDFHQYYRKTNVVLKMQSKFNEKIELMEDFLRNKNKLRETVQSCLTPNSWTALQETLKFYRKCHEEMEIRKRAFYDSAKILHELAEETLAHVPKESDVQKVLQDVDKNVILCKERRVQLQPTLDDLQTEIVKLENEIERDFENANSERDQMEAKIIGFTQRVKFDTGLLREETNLLKNKAMKVITAQQETITEIGNEILETKTEIEKVSAENRAIEEDIDRLRTKKDEVDRDFSSVENELSELIAKRDIHLAQVKAKTERYTVLMKTKTEELDGIKSKILTRETKKKDLIEKLERLRLVTETKTKISQLQNELTASKQEKQALEGTIIALKSDQEVKESIARKVDSEIDASEGRIQELLQQVEALYDWQSEEKKAQDNFLETILCVKGSENSSYDSKMQEVSSMYDEVLETLFSITELEHQCKQIQKDNKELDDTNRAKKNQLRKVLFEREHVDNEIRMLKKLVRDKHYTTVQEVNRKITDIIKTRKEEALIVDELIKEVKEKELILEELKKLGKLKGKEEKEDK